MKKTAPSNLTATASNPAEPHAAEEKLRAIAAQEERRTLVDQEERRAQADQEQRRAQAVRTQAQMPAHAALVPAALVPAALVPTEAARDLKAARDLEGVQDTPICSDSAFRETPDGASVPVTNGASVPAPASICAFTPARRQSSQTIQKNCFALPEGCRALLAWYDEYAEETEQRQQQKAEDFADWQQSRNWQQSRSGRTVHSQGGGVSPRHAPAPARPLPLRAGKRTRLGRAHQHWDTPEGRFLVQVRLGEAVLLPAMRAQDGEERGAVNAQVATGFGLAGAVASGLLMGFAVCWQATGRWPRRPVSVLLFWPGGKVQGDRLRGKYGPLLVHLQEEARVHFHRVHFNPECSQ